MSLEQIIFAVGAFVLSFITQKLWTLFQKSTRDESKLIILNEIRTFDAKISDLITNEIKKITNIQHELHIEFLKLQNSFQLLSIKIDHHSNQLDNHEKKIIMIEKHSNYSPKSKTSFKS